MAFDIELSNPGTGFDINLSPTQEIFSPFPCFFRPVIIIFLMFYGLIK